MRGLPATPSPFHQERVSAGAAACFELGEEQLHAHIADRQIKICRTEIMRSQVVRIVLNFQRECADASRIRHGGACAVG